MGRAKIRRELSPRLYKILVQGGGAKLPTGMLVGPDPTGTSSMKRPFTVGPIRGDAGWWFLTISKGDEEVTLFSTEESRPQAQNDFISRILNFSEDGEGADLITSFRQWWWDRGAN